MQQDFTGLDKSIVKKGAEMRDLSASEIISPVSDFSGETSSFNDLASTVHAAAPFTATARTNFTSDAPHHQQHGTREPHGSQPCLPYTKDNDLHSPDAPFQDYSTPAHGALSTMRLIAPPGCGQSCYRPILFILIAILLGTIVGGILKFFKVDAIVGEWIMMPGTLFVRAVNCVVVLMVFVNLVVATADIAHKRLGTWFGVRILLALFSLILVATLVGLATAILTHSLFTAYLKEKSVFSTNAIVGIQCGNNKYLDVGMHGVVTCSAPRISRTSQFSLGDVNNALKGNDALTGTNTTLSDNILSIVKVVVPANIMAALISNTLLSIAAFALPFGASLAYSFHGPAKLNPLLTLFREVKETLVLMTHFLHRITPIAVFSLLAGSLDTMMDDSVAKDPLEVIVMMVIAMALGALVHMFVLVPGVFVLITRQNPFRFMLHMMPAYVYSFGCSSSMLTLPLTLECIQASREMASPVVHFVLSMGTTLHKPGTAIYLVIMVHAMSDLVGIEHAHSFFSLLLSFLGVSLCSFKAPPIPSGALLVLTSAWNIVFPEYAIPDKVFALVTVSDVFLNRFVTLCNVNAQAMLCIMLADKVDPNDESE
ncbi:hypothetical protein PsorP6_018077 [Peronosclerospora sorghi]|uniref:Uncharacterized protein n=1 Tax=Peronosclerospora sorghi TaxID=230839 RepID=A0ACC0WDH2_9STRA|nr:hypothetical protein PsorP6_018077 [Peronosclerospora sorghi]